MDVSSFQLEQMNANRPRSIANQSTEREKDFSQKVTLHLLAIGRNKVRQVS